MALHNTRLILAVAWVAFTFLMFWITGASSGFSFLLLAIAAVVPPLIMLALWTEGPPQTIAEVLHDAERKPPAARR